MAINKQSALRYTTRVTVQNTIQDFLDFLKFSDGISLSHSRPDQFNVSSTELDVALAEYIETLEEYKNA